MEQTINKATETYQDLWGLVKMVGGVLLLTLLALWMIGSQYNLLAGLGIGQDPLLTAETGQTTFMAKTGVRIVRVAVTGGGGIIDLRYQIVDPDKAVVVHDDENPPALIDEATGQVVSRPWHDHAHDQDLHPAVIYYELLWNPGGVLKRGSTVTVRIGDARLEHVVVQ